MAQVVTQLGLAVSETRFDQVLAAVREQVFPRQDRMAFAGPAATSLPAATPLAVPEGTLSDDVRQAIAER